LFQPKQNAAAAKRFRSFSQSQSLSAVCAPFQRLEGGTMRRADTGCDWLKTFQGCFSVLFWPKKNKYRNCFISVLFGFSAFCAL